jgi:hypothetical protein
MPATSKKQKTFMDAVAHNPAFAKKTGVPQSVGKDFSEASKGMKFGKDRSVATRADRQTVNNPKTNQGKQELFKEGGSMATKMNPGFMAMMAKKKAGAKSEMPSKMGKPVMKKGMDTAKDGMKKMANGGITSAKMGAVKTAAPSKDGVATKGKTKGAQVKMSGSKPLGMKSGGKAYC